MENIKVKRQKGYKLGFTLLLHNLPYVLLN